MEKNREKEILDALSNKDREQLKKLKITAEEIESVSKIIDKKIEDLDFEILESINNVEEKINYNFGDEYRNYYLNHPSLKLENNILKLDNGNEKVVRHFYSMDPNSKIYILKFQEFDSNLKDQLVPFGELEFGDTLCFERETNKIVLYNHELDTFDVIANDWNDFEKRLCK